MQCPALLHPGSVASSSHCRHAFSRCGVSLPSPSGRCEAWQSAQHAAVPNTTRPARGSILHGAPRVSVQTAASASGDSGANLRSPSPEPGPGPTSAAAPGDRAVMGAAARAAIIRATRAVQRYGWISFWVQLSLSVVSAVILLFSVAFTSQSGPKASLYLTLVGILAGFLSTFWNFGYTRTGIKMQRYIDAPPGVEVPKVKKQNVMDMVTKGVIINVLGLGSTLLGIQALVGVLVAKTLANASANPFIASAAGVYNPVLALDVFLVQAATNMLLGHFLSLTCSLWLLNVVGEGRGDRFQRFLSLERLRGKQREGSPELRPPWI